MLLRHRTTRIGSRPPEPSQGFEHVDPSALAVLRWLKDNHVEFVLVGALAEALRGRVDSTGPVSIVPAPYRRNLTRLAAALSDAGACLRVDGAGPGGSPDSTPVKFTAEKLADAQHWALRCGSTDLDVERSGRAGQKAAARAPIYQELLYEAGRFEPAEALSVEVASPEDVEHFAHLRRTGRAPEMRVSRQPKPEPEPDELNEPNEPDISRQRQEGQSRLDAG